MSLEIPARMTFVQLFIQLYINKVVYVRVCFTQSYDCQNKIWQFQGLNLLPFTCPLICYTMQRNLLLVTHYTWFEERVATNTLKNRAGKIREKKEILNTTGKPADIGSRGMSVAKMGQLWCKGPWWFRDSDNWPSDIKAKETVETEKEARIIKDMTTSTTLKSGATDEILLRFIYSKFLRITS